MSWPTTPQDKQLLANAQLTPIQLEVVQLRLAKVSWRTIADSLQLDESTCRGHYQRAARKIRRAKGAT